MFVLLRTPCLGVDFRGTCKDGVNTGYVEREESSPPLGCFVTAVKLMVFFFSPLSICVAALEDKSGHMVPIQENSLLCPSVSCLLALSTSGGPLGPALEQEPGPPHGAHRRASPPPTSGLLAPVPWSPTSISLGDLAWVGMGVSSEGEMLCVGGGSRGGEAGCCRLLSSRQRKSGRMTKCQPAPPVSGCSSLQTRNAAGQSVSAFLSVGRQHQALGHWG